MAAQKLFVEVQDEQGNIYYVHTSSDVVFCADGETVEEKLKNATPEKDGRMSAEDKKKLDGIAEGANKYVHPTGSGNKHIPSGGSAGQVLRWSADGTAVWGADKDTTYAAFKAATSSAAGGAGLVPAPAAGNHDDYLRGDGKWGAASDMVQTFSQASSRANIASGEANKTLFGKIAKWFADLGGSGIAAFAKIVNNGTTTVANTVLDGRFGKILLDRIVAAEKNITAINSSLDDRTNGKVRIWQDDEGGNIEITSPNGMKWQMDSHNDNDFRLYKNNSGELGPFYAFSGGADKGGNIATETYVQTTLDAEMDNVKVYSDLVGITFTPDGESQEYSWGTYFVPAGYCFLNAVIADNSQLQGKYVGIITQRYNKSNRMVSLYLNWRYSGVWEVLITLAKEKR